MMTYLPPPPPPPPPTEPLPLGTSSESLTNYSKVSLDENSITSYPFPTSLTFSQPYLSSMASTGGIDYGSSTNTNFQEGSRNPKINQPNEELLFKAASNLEVCRSLHAEQEACLLFTSTLLSSNVTGGVATAPAGLSVESAQTLPASVKDAWLAFVQNAHWNMNDTDADEIDPRTGPGGIATATSATVTASTNMNATGSKMEYALPSRTGQLVKAAHTTALSTSLFRAAEVAQTLHQRQKEDAQCEVDTLRIIAAAQREEIEHNEQNYSDVPPSTTASWIMDAFYRRVAEIREYHARHDPTHPTASITSPTTTLVNIPLTGQQQPGEEPPVRKRKEDVFYSLYDPSQDLGSTYRPQNTNKVHPLLKKVKRVGNPNADGYDLYSFVHTNLQKIQNGDIFSVEEVFGKYLDFLTIHQSIITSSEMNHLFLSALASTFDNRSKQQQGSQYTKSKNPLKVVEGDEGEGEQKISYPDFLSLLLQQGLMTSIPEEKKLLHRKKYTRFLLDMKEYLVGFLQRVTPLLHIQMDVLDPVVSDFIQEWSLKGGITPGWKCIPSEAILASTLAPICTQQHGHPTTISTIQEEKKTEDPVTETAVSKRTTIGIDLTLYSSPEDLSQRVDGENLKVELSRLGMKCGGTPLDRAKRLWLTKDTPLDKLPSKLFVKPIIASGISTNIGTVAVSTKTMNNGMSSLEEETSNTTGHGATSLSRNEKNDLVTNLRQPISIHSRRIDVAFLELVVMTLLDHLRPTLDATARRSERRLTQTSNEKDRELIDDICGPAHALDTVKSNDKKNSEENDDDEEDEEEAPIYNPKGVPLGWDGKPIPYWLFKLHGLNHFYPCEICGNESYRGRRAFEKHFAESKHAYGMRCLGIPNTKHFHGVTKIEDAQELWAKLQKYVSKDAFDGSKEEQYEDSQGNILSRTQYEDLARQGLL